MISVALAVLESEEQRNELDILYEKNKDTFLAIALKILKNLNDAEDALQEAFLSVVKYPDTFFNIPENKRVAYIIVYYLRGIWLQKNLTCYFRLLTFVTFL